jgi:hypothetical protein
MFTSEAVVKNALVPTEATPEGIVILVSPELRNAPSLIVASVEPASKVTDINEDIFRNALTPIEVTPVDTTILSSAEP